MYIFLGNAQGLCSRVQGGVHAPRPDGSLGSSYLTVYWGHIAKAVCLVPYGYMCIILLLLQKNFRTSCKIKQLLFP
jgi:hypothetical protein